MTFLTKKNFALIGMCVGVLVVIFGIIALAGVDYSRDLGGHYYDTGFASFGGDFYSYVNNNTAQAVHAITNQSELINKAIGKVGGLILLSMGLLAICRFGVMWVEEKAAEPKPANAAPAAPDTAEPNAPQEATITEGGVKRIVHAAEERKDKDMEK